ncbi:ABC transporter permease [Bacillus sp. DNRA2]|uniref:ABC transporter permease n=1 Tax=Bacillus sp. DNRA2 TaxID=2723053 RepID=UPI00145CB976|nr:ABC transporter permease [Bacillus sp. DNRA2]NMD69156.1 ABC transporter permease [Bacillus sp. DNRA2]
MKARSSYLAPSLLILVLVFCWEIGARLMAMPYILPAPSEIANKLWVLRSTLLFDHLPATLLIVVIGLGISIVLGVGLSVWMHASKTIERAVYPLMIVSQTIPTIALAPIFVLWFGYSIWSKVVVTVLITFFPIAVNTFDGLRSSNKELRELMLTMGAKKKDIFLKLDIPSALPFFYSGLKVAFPLSVIGAAIGEWLGAQAGLGYFSRRMMTQFDGAGVFAPIILLSLLGIGLFLIVILIEKRSFRWRK